MHLSSNPQSLNNKKRAFEYLQEKVISCTNFL